MSSEEQAVPPETTRLDLAGAAPATEAEAVIDCHQRFVLNNTDRDRLLKALASDEGSNEALVQAVYKFNEKYGR